MSYRIGELPLTIDQRIDITKWVSPLKRERWWAAMFPKTYHGMLDQPLGWTVLVEQAGDRTVLPLRLDVRNHSPSGLAWGYGGSGPAQCALALLCDVVGPERATAGGLYQMFKSEVVARLAQDRGWHISAYDIEQWVKAREAGFTDQLFDPRTLGDPL